MALAFKKHPVEPHIATGCNTFTGLCAEGGQRAPARGDDGRGPERKCGCAGTRGPSVAHCDGVDSGDYVLHLAHS